MTETYSTRAEVAEAAARELDLERDGARELRRRVANLKSAAHQCRHAGLPIALAHAIGEACAGLPDEPTTGDFWLGSPEAGSIRFTGIAEPVSNGIRFAGIESLDEKCDRLEREVVTAREARDHVQAAHRKLSDECERLRDRVAEESQGRESWMASAERLRKRAESAEADVQRLTRERDEWLADAHKQFVQLSCATAERKRLRPVVDAACAWRDRNKVIDLVNPEDGDPRIECLDNLTAAVDTLRATETEPAISKTETAEPEPGEPIGTVGCPSCGRLLEIDWGDDPGEISATTSGAEPADPSDPCADCAARKFAGCGSTSTPCSSCDPHQPGGDRWRPEPERSCELTPEGELLQAAQGILEWESSRWRVTIDEAIAPLVAAMDRMHQPKPAPDSALRRASGNLLACAEYNDATQRTATVFGLELEKLRAALAADAGKRSDV